MRGLQEVPHANGRRRNAPLLPPQRIALKRLWEKLSEETRQQTLRTLGQIVTRQLVPPPETKEVPHEDR